MALQRYLVTTAVNVAASATTTDKNGGKTTAPGSAGVLVADTIRPGRVILLDPSSALYALISGSLAPVTATSLVTPAHVAVSNPGNAGGLSE